MESWLIVYFLNMSDTGTLFVKEMLQVSMNLANIAESLELLLAVNLVLIHFPPLLSLMGWTQLLYVVF